MTIAIQANDMFGNPVRAPIANRAFGIELEVLYPYRATHSSIAADLTRLCGFPVVNESYGHAAPRQWKVTHDGSVSDGGEIVSPKLMGEDGIAQAVAVTKALQSLGCKVDKSTGFHIHVDGAELTAKELGKIGICFFWFETFFDHIMPESRRGSQSQFVPSNRKFYGSGYGAVELNAGIAAINTAIETGNRAKVVSAINPRCYCQSRRGRETQRCGCSGRYAKLNATPINNQGSLEFRQHSGTVEHDKVANWIRLMVQFVEKGKKTMPRPRSNVRDWSAAEEMNLFFSMFGIDSELAAYYRDRRSTIKKQDMERGARVATELAARIERDRAEAEAWNEGHAERQRIEAEARARREAERAEMYARIEREAEAERIAGAARIADLMPFANALRAAMTTNEANLRVQLAGSYSQIRSNRASRIVNALCSLDYRIRGGDAYGINHLANNALRRHYVTAADWRRMVHLRPAPASDGFAERYNRA